MKCGESVSSVGCYVGPSNTNAGGPAAPGEPVSIRHRRVFSPCHARGTQGAPEKSSGVELSCVLFRERPRRHDASVGATPRSRRAHKCRRAARQACCLGGLNPRALKIYPLEGSSQATRTTNAVRAVPSCRATPAGIEAANPAHSPGRSAKPPATPCRPA